MTFAESLLLIFVGVILALACYFIVRWSEERLTTRRGVETTPPQVAVHPAERPPFNLTRIFEIYLASLIGAITASLFDIYLRIQDPGEKTAATILIVGVLFGYSILYAFVLWIIDWSQWTIRRRRQ